MDVILGTAGHIDHGKTSLVRALTGIDCDRLDEEKKRGITIELGFAWLDLPDGRRLGIVDVPGHERFVKNMVAGASGVDFVLLVIAADEGVMPQTREHLEICSLLGVRTGLVALTKVDMVDGEWLAAVEEDVKNALKGTFLANAPIVHVSSLTGAGLDELREEIFSQIEKLGERPKTDIFRLPVDRVFSMKGFGTVVTGTLVSGSCSQGEKLCIMPGGKTAKARSLQVHNEQVEAAHQGQRCAVNLQGLDVGDIQRGDVVARPDTLFPSQSWYVRLNCLKSSPLPIRNRSEVHFHHGSKECLARIVFLDREKLEPGESALAQVKFDQPIAAIYGDHCVIRSHSPLRAIGGGIVISPLPSALRKRLPDYARKLALLQELGAPDMIDSALLAPKTPETLTNLCLGLCDAPGADTRHLKVMTALPEADLDSALARLQASGAAFCWDASEGCWICSEELQKCLAQCRESMEALHKREPLRSNFPPSSIIAGWGSQLPEKFTQALLELAVGRGLLAQDGTGLKLAAHTVNFSKSDAKILDSLAKKIAAGGMAPPFIKEIIEESGWDLKKIQPMLNYLCDTGQLLKIQEGVYYSKKEFEQIVEKIRAWFETNPELEIGDFREILCLSRKYAIPVLEYLDASRVTYRAGNKRRLRKN